MCPKSQKLCQAALMVLICCFIDRSNCADSGEDPFVLSLYPSCGPVTGGTNVTVYGIGLGTNVYCWFGSTSVLAVQLSRRDYSCISPSGQAGAAAFFVVVQNQYNVSSSSSPTFYYYAAPVPTSVSPNSGITNGNTALTVSGSSFPTDQSAYCNALCRFGSMVTVRGTPSSTFNSLKCTAPSGFNFSSSTVSFEITLNGVDFIAASLTYTYTGPLQVGVIANVGDLYFNASALTRSAKLGLDRALAAFGVSYIVRAQASAAAADIDAVFNYLVRNMSCKSIVSMGSNAVKLSALLRSAASWPSVHYNMIDCTAPIRSNVQGIQFREDQIGYAVGYLSGLLTTTRVLGFIGGDLSPDTRRFRAGFSFGVYATCGDCTVYAAMLEDKLNTTRGVAIANDFVTQRGADFLFGNAGALGSAAITQAALLGAYVIGSGTDEYYTTFGNGTLPGANKIITSTKRSGEVAAYDAIQREYFGQFSPGNWIVGLSEGAVALEPCHETCDLWTQSIRDALSLMVSQFIGNTRETGVDYATGSVVGNAGTAGFTNIVPMCAPTSGGTLINLQGIGFYTNGVIPKCFFGDSLFTRATVSGARLMKCTTPPRTVGTVPFRVTLNGVDDLTYFEEANYKFYDSPSGLSLSPTTGPLSGSTVVTISGTGVIQPGAVCLPACRFGGVKSPQASWGAGTVLCSSPAVGGMSSVLVEVALNQVDFVTVGTFDYYVACSAGLAYDVSTSSCQPCPAGYSAAAGERQCTPCGLGQYTDGLGHPECHICPIGSFANSTASQSCYSCAPGSVAPQRNSSSCTLCSPGYFQDREGQSQCLACKGGFALSHGSDHCEDCPSGAECPGGSAVRPLPGYWAVPWESLSFSECIKAAACPNDNGTSLCRLGHDGVLCASCIRDYSLDSDKLCQKCGDPNVLKFLAFLVGLLILAVVVYMVRSAYQAAISRQKDKDEVAVLVKIIVSYAQVTSLSTEFNLKWPGFILSFFEGEKIASSPLNSLISMDCLLQDSLSGTRPVYASVLSYVLLPPIFLLVVALFFAALASLKQLRRRLRLQGRSHRFIVYQPAQERSSPKEAGRLTASALNQAGCEVYDARAVGRWEGQIAGKGEGLDLGAKRMSSKSRLDFCLPSGREDVVAGRGDAESECGRGESLQSSRIQSSKTKMGASYSSIPEDSVELAEIGLTDWFFLTSVVAFFLLYPAVTQAIFTIYRCDNLSGRLLLAKDLTIDCSSTMHKSWSLALGLPAILIIVIGLPTAAFTYLWRQRTSINDIKTGVRIGFLCRGYRNKFLLWEAVILTRKISVIAVSVFFSGMVATQGLLCLGVLILTTILQTSCRPFQRQLNNFLEMMSTIVSLVTLYGGMHFFNGLSSAEESGLTVTLMTLNIAFIATWAFFFFKALLSAVKRKGRALSQKISQGIKSFHSSRMPTPSQSPRSANKQRAAASATNLVSALVPALAALRPSTTSPAISPRTVAKSKSLKRANQVHPLSQTESNTVGAMQGTAQSQPLPTIPSSSRDPAALKNFQLTTDMGLLEVASMMDQPISGMSAWPERLDVNGGTTPDQALPQVQRLDSPMFDRGVERKGQPGAEKNQSEWASRESRRTLV